MSQDKKVRFRIKYFEPKDDCINCPNSPTLEAIVVGSTHLVPVPCCTDEPCKRRAAELALLGAKAFV